METPRYLGIVAHPAIGIRLPDILLEGILTAFKRSRTTGTLMLSYGRETAPQWVIDAPSNTYEITMGHTGTSIREYLTKGAEKAREKNVLVEMEADHLTVTSSTVRAVKRISGVKEYYLMSDDEISKALDYIKSEIDEAISTKVINFFTIDTCELIDYNLDKISEDEVKRRFEETFDEDKRKELLKRFKRRWFFIGASGRSFEIKFTDIDLMRLALKYRKSIEVTKEIFDYIKEKISWPFGIEVAFDETPYLTNEKDLLFYLIGLENIGIHADYIAPNVGFEKKQDYRGDLKILERRLEKLAAIARANGTMLCFHSGSGSSPYSGKGVGTYEAILRATNGDIKYKVSGVYIELIFEIMASFPIGTKPRILYEEIFDAVYDYLLSEIEKHGPLYSDVLEKQIRSYTQALSDGKILRRDPHTEFFRYYSFIALNLRENNVRKYRNELIELYQSDKRFREVVDKEVESLTLRLIDGLKFRNNIDKITNPLI